MNDQTNVTPDTTSEAPPAPVEAPPVAGEPPADPDLLGQLLPEEIGTLTALRQRNSQLTFELGNLVAREARITNILFQMEKQAQDVLDAVGKRLNVPDGTQFQVMPDGSVRRTELPSA